MSEKKSENENASPEALLETLKPLMERLWAGGGLFEFAMGRMLGRESLPAPSLDPSPDGLKAVGEGDGASGLHKYGVNHLKPVWDGALYALEEAVDGAQQLGVLLAKRVELGLEEIPPERMFQLDWARKLMKSAATILWEDCVERGVVGEQPPSPDPFPKDGEGEDAPSLNPSPMARGAREREADPGEEGGTEDG